MNIPETSIFNHVFSKKQLNPDSTAFIDISSGRTYSRKEVHSISLQLAWAIQNVLHLKSGDFVAIFSVNSALWALTFLGCNAAGVGVTTVNSSYTPNELRNQLIDSRAVHIFVHPQQFPVLRDTLKIMNIPEATAKERVVIIDPSGKYVGFDGWRRFEDLLGNGRLQQEESADGRLSHNTTLLCYSSGTTGLAKGVELSHHNVISVVTMAAARMTYLTHTGTAVAVLPLFHIYGLVCLLCLCLHKGTRLVIMPSFTPESFLETLQTYKVVVGFVVPPILVVLANHPAVDNYDFSHLKVLASGAAPTTEGLALAVSKRLAKNGADVAVVQGWGMTETSAPSTTTGLTVWREKIGASGILLPNMEARIVGDDDMDVPEGEVGEFWIRGPSVMKGYWKNDKATRETITTDGWLKTGDIAFIDKDGYLTFIDRKKELIKYKGFQVPPAELEGLLLTHPKIADAAVIGIWSEAEATEYPKAYVVPRGGLASLKTEKEKSMLCEEVQAWVRERVAKHKFLRGGIELVDSIPKSPSGKILRKDLRELVKAKPRAKL